MEKKPKKRPAPDFGDPPLPALGDIVSAQELTGLIPVILPEQNKTELARTLSGAAVPHPAGTDTDETA